MLPKLCLATNNAHKIEEIKPLLSTKYDLLSLRDIGCRVDLPENQTTFEGNALEKAQYIWDNFGVSCIADDSGLEVEALNGEPGVYSARYAGLARIDASNVALLLQKLQNHKIRKANFRTCIALILNGEVHYFNGTIEGTITHAPQGTNGFGYDPIFVPNGHDRTFAQMQLHEKNSISHRAIATKQLLEFLNGIS